jgi:hypothetical protein
MFHAVRDLKPASGQTRLPRMGEIRVHRKTSVCRFGCPSTKADRPPSELMWYRCPFKGSSSRRKRLPGTLANGNPSAHRA